MAHPASVDLERVYVWEIPVRLAHWIIFFSILILSVTGYYIGRPFIDVPNPATDHFVMGTARAIHLYTAIVFSLAVLVRIYWLFDRHRSCPLHRHRGVEFAISNLRFFGTTVRRVANRTTDPSYLHVAGAASGDYPRLFVLPVVDGRECWRA